MDRIREHVADVVGENIDALLHIDLKGCGVPLELYRAARAQAQGPVVMNAARKLQQRVQPGDSVLLVTGFISPPWYRAEHDGLAGTAILARALEMTLSAIPVVVVEQELKNTMERLLRNVGLVVYDEYDSVVGKGCTGWVVGFPVGRLEVDRASQRLLGLCQPKAIIAIERPGPNCDGRYHFVSGEEIVKCISEMEIPFEMMKEAGYLTIGIGDNGNELGLGSIADVTRTVHRASHIATSIAADAVVTASVADWGAFGLAAALAFLAQRKDALACSSVLERLIWASIDSGIIDGSRGYAVTRIDDIELDFHVLLLDMLHHLLIYGESATSKYRTRIEWYVERIRSGSS